ncbi:efflux RND transporter periplasmic adaptor subunit [Brevundimonas balnearis]|uniref:Efflux RND transporter periplasmic adaptor subunit n=1 Tax=Brevundimonas balnearis TaxID=1572858 RepID=A0ABV6R512_9CAUL
MIDWTRASALATASALTLLLAACGEGGAEKADAAPVANQTVTAATVAALELPRTVTASGTISPWEDVRVGAETGGLTATQVYVEEGQYVRQGQVLVQLNDDLLQADVRSQQASVAQAEANLARETAELGRARELRERGFLSQASLDQAVSEERSARATLDQARAQLSATRTRLEQTRVRAPVAGLVSARSVTRGQIVQAGTELFRLVRDGRVELDAQVPEAELRLVRAGQPATVTSDQTGSTTGTVRIVTPQVDPQTRLGVARISVPAASGLRPGMFARAEINVGAQPSLVIPSSAIVYREGQAGVYVIGRGDVVSFTAVQPGVRQGDLLAINSGLTAGQRVVVQGAGFLGEGDRVRIVAPVTRDAATAAARQAATADQG